MNPFFTYKPSKTSGIIGQEKALSTINQFLDTFQGGFGLFLYGPYGSGKTSSIYAFAKEKGYEILELNASDSRNQKQINEFLSNATGQMSLFATKKLILLDELDGLSGMKDRGAAITIAKFMKKSKFPIIATALNAFEKKVSPIKKSSKLVEFKLLDSKNVLEIMKNVLEQENIKVEEAILKKIARECGGDARAALNDLFSYVLTEETLESSDRVGTDSMTQALTRVLKSKDKKIFLGAYDNVVEDLDKIFLWLDENLPKEYVEAEDLAKGFEVLSLADRFRGRIRKWQYYRFYVYCYQLLSAGVALAKKVKYSVPPNYKQSMRLLKYWQANITYAKRKSIISKIAAKTNTSSKRALQDIFPTLLYAMVNDEDVAKELDLTSEEISWLKNQVNKK